MIRLNYEIEAPEAAIKSIRVNNKSATPTYEVEWTNGQTTPAHSVEEISILSNTRNDVKLIRACIYDDLSVGVDEFTIIAWRIVRDVCRETTYCVAITHEDIECRNCATAIIEKATGRIFTTSGLEFECVEKFIEHTKEAMDQPKSD